VASSLMMLHTNESLADQEIIPGVYITADGSKVQELIEQRPEPSLVVANYSGWGPGQLDRELRADSWLTLPATIEHVFWTGEKELWNVVVNQVQTRKLTELVGVHELPPDPSLN
jgi:putative transcriptional regulator